MNERKEVVGRTLLIVLYVLITDVALYAVWSMGHWNIHPGEWDELSRFLFAVLYFMTLAGGYIAVMDILSSSCSKSNGSARKTETTRQVWNNQLPLISAYAQGKNIEFNSGMAGSGAVDHWIPVGNRCSFEWPAHYYRLAEQEVASQLPQTV